jgi:hypothetical protein
MIAYEASASGVNVKTASVTSANVFAVLVTSATRSA